jgi:prefoldin alpha subunit
MTKEEELSQYMYQIEQYKEQLNQLDIQSQYLQSAMLDYSKAKITLEKLDKLDKEVDMLVPIGGGTFLDSKVNNSSKVLIDIGMGYVIEKINQDAIKKIDKRIKELEKTQDRLNETIEQVQNEVATVSAKAQELVGEEKK